MPRPSILITGASGFIGGQLFRRFQELGWSVHGIGRRALQVEGYTACDLTQPIANAIVEQLRGVDVILHAAARSSPWGRRRDFQQANVGATRHMVELARRLQCKKFIFLSSSSVYYLPRDQFDLSEKSPHAQPAVNLYAESKQQAEAFVREYEGRWCILRPRAVYGVGDTVLFPRILASAAAGRLPLLVRQGSPAVGDLLSIDNLVDICVQAAHRLDVVGEYNLTDNQAVEIVPFLLDVFDRLGIPRPTRQVSTRFAFRLAWILEMVHALALPTREPPITRFGVHVFAYSKTFDVSRMLQTFGTPRQTVDRAVEQFVNWVKHESPYDLSK